MTMPGVQKPHCSPWLSWKAACIGCSSPLRASPSMVVTLAPSACTASTVHDFTDSPSRWMVHAPHDDVSHPMFVPVSPATSRMYCTSSSRGSTSSSCDAPFTSMETFMPSSCRVFGLGAERRLGRLGHARVEPAEHVVEHRGDDLRTVVDQTEVRAREGDDLDGTAQDRAPPEQLVARFVAVLVAREQDRGCGRRPRPVPHAHL